MMRTMKTSRGHASGCARLIPRRDTGSIPSWPHGPIAKAHVDIRRRVASAPPRETTSHQYMSRNPRRGTEVDPVPERVDDHPRWEDVRDLQEAPREQEVPVRHAVRLDRGVRGGPDDRRVGGGEEEDDRGEEEDDHEVAVHLVGPERDPRLLGRPRRAVLPGEPRLALEDALPDRLDLHGSLSGA